MPMLSTGHMTYLWRSGETISDQKSLLLLATSVFADLVVRRRRRHRFYRMVELSSEPFPAVADPAFFFFFFFFFFSEVASKSVKEEIYRI